MWLATLGCFDPEDVSYEDFVEAGDLAAAILKEVEECDFVIALTHMRTFNDNILAEKSKHIDLILGGHDHFLYLNQTNDNLVVKSGTDYKNLSHITIEFCDKKPKWLEEPKERLNNEYEEDTPCKIFTKQTYSKKSIFTSYY